MNNDILYDCYDKNGKPLGIIFACDCAELLKKNSNVKYVLGFDAIKRQRVWHEVKENGLWPTSFSK